MPNGSTSQDVLALMQTQNKATVKRIRTQGSSLTDECAAKSLFDAHADGQEQTFRNQEFIVERLVNGHRNPPKTKSTKTFSLGPLKMEGFDVRDVARILVVVAGIYIIFSLLGMRTTMQEMRQVVEAAVPAVHHIEEDQP